MSQILGTSITVLLWRQLFRWYGQIEQRVDFIYLNSQTFRLTKRVLESIKACFRYSLLGRITEIKEENPEILGNSRAVQYLIDSYKGWKDKVIYYSKTSSTISLAKDTQRELYLSPVRIISLIVVIAILVNVALSVILQKQIELWGFLIRVLFLFAGTAGLSCEADWPAVKESSIFLRKTPE